MFYVRRRFCQVPPLCARRSGTSFHLVDTGLFTTRSKAIVRTSGWRSRMIRPVQAASLTDIKGGVRQGPV